MPRCFLALVALCLSFVSLSAGEEGWLTDLETAKKVAQAEKKDILVDFTGSDWCGWCIRLKKEVFDQPQFAEASKYFVLVEIDFPRSKTLAPELKAKNDALAKKYNIQGFPTILLLDAQGEVYAQTGYQAGGPESYLKHLAQLRRQNTAEGKQALAARLEFEAKEHALTDALSAQLDPLLEKKDLAGAEVVLAKFIKDRNVTGELRLSLLKARAQIVAMCKPGDHEAVIKVIDEVLAESKDSSTLEELKELRVRVVAVRDEALKSKTK